MTNTIPLGTRVPFERLPAVTELPVAPECGGGEPADAIT